MAFVKKLITSLTVRSPVRIFGGRVLYWCGSAFRVDLACRYISSTAVAALHRMFSDIYGHPGKIDWTVNLLVKDAKLAGQTSYQGLISHCYGKTGLILISVFQFVFAYGAMCGELLFVFPPVS